MDKAVILVLPLRSNVKTIVALIVVSAPVGGIRMRRATDPSFFLGAAEIAFARGAWARRRRAPGGGRVSGRKGREEFPVKSGF
jgi:hypothetical protein